MLDKLEVLDFIKRILDWDFYDNTGQNYAIALGIMLSSYLVLRIVRKVVLVRLKKLSAKTVTDIDDILVEAISKIKVFSYLLISLYLGLIYLTLPNWLDKSFTIIFLVTLVFEGIQLIKRIIKFFLIKALSKNGEEDQAEATVKTINIFILIILWSLGGLLILSNMGVNITSLIAGLGIGGIAIALALQNILSDVFASFSILIDKPFKVGDFIISNDDMGVVKKIGIKTTRLQTLDGQMLIISNQELTNVRVQNYYDIQKRRALFNLGVVYETKKEVLKEIPDIIKDIVSKTDFAELDRCHFKSYGDYSLNFEISIYINKSGYNDFLNVLESINLEIFSRFANKGIEFAYPTQLEYQKQA